MEKSTRDLCLRCRFPRTRHISPESQRADLICGRFVPQSKEVTARPEHWTAPAGLVLVGPYSPHPGSIHLVREGEHDSLCGRHLNAGLQEQILFQAEWKFGWGALYGRTIPPGRKLCERCQRFSETARLEVR